jgi:hypothetical protein
MHDEKKSLIDSIMYNDFEAVKKTLEENIVDPSLNQSHTLRAATAEGYYDISKLLIDDGRVDVNYFVGYASTRMKEEEYLIILKELILLNKFDFTEDNNYLIVDAIKLESYAIAELLWANDSVKRTLKNDSVETYNYFIKKEVKSKIKEF